MKTAYLFLVILLFTSLNAFSQIEGDVRDQANHRISKAIIIAKDTTGSFVDSVLSDTSGFYSFKNLKPGIYFIEARAQDFKNRLYKNVIARKNFLDPDAGRDLSSATRLQIVLSPIKKPKQ